MLLKNIFCNSARKVAVLTAKVIRYIGFSHYNCMERDCLGGVENLEKSGNLVLPNL